MYKKSLLQPILFGLVTLVFAVSCDKDFNEFGTNIVGDDHFGFERYTDATVKAYNQKIGEIASNNLPINALGFYSNPAFGTTQANFVTQVELSSSDPTFNNTDTTLYVDLPVIDSVVMNIPYFSHVPSDATIVDNVKPYVLDSIFGEKPFETGDPVTSKFKLSVFQSNYFLRDLDPDQALAAGQLYYTGQTQDNVIDNNKINVLLNNAPLTDPASGSEGTHNADGRENENFYFDKKEHKLTTYETDGTTKKYTRYAPSMRLHLRSDVFYNKILNAPSGQLADNATFRNYFRGLYFKVENGNPGNMAMLNFKKGTITIYYKEDKITPDNPDTTPANEYKLERISKSYALNLTGNTISLLKNSAENPNYLTAANNTTQEASQLYLKGGEGSMAIVDVFGTTDVKGLTVNPAFNSSLPISLSNPRFVLDPAYDPSLPISDTNPKYLITGPNGISDEIDNIKANDWLINEANLTFYINKPAMSDSKTVEPNRIYLYDLTNKQPIVDFTYDLSTDANYPKRSKYIFGGILANDDGSTTKQIKNTSNVISNKGTKYKIRITSYVRNLINKDSTNVRLGLSVSESIANTGLSKLKTPNANVDRAPTMSVMSPLGTILYGTNVPFGDPNYDNRIKLEIYYTKPN